MQRGNLRAVSDLCCVCALLVHGTVFASEAEDTIVYTRVDAVATTTGEVQLRRAYTKRRFSSNR